MCVLSYVATAQMLAYFKDHFFKAFTWALAHPSAVETTKVGLLDAALSHLNQVGGLEAAGTGPLCSNQALGELYVCRKVF